MSDYAYATLKSVVTHKGQILTPMEARQFAADLIASATLVDGIDCANAWHNSAKSREAQPCPECRPFGSAPVAYVTKLEFASHGVVTNRSGETRSADRMTDGSVHVYTTVGVRDATKVEAESYQPV